MMTKRRRLLSGGVILLATGLCLSPTQRAHAQYPQPAPEKERRQAPAPPRAHPEPRPSNDTRAAPKPSPARRKPRQSASRWNHRRDSHDVPIQDAAALEKEVRAYKGKVLIVDFWATSSGASTREFPALVWLYKRYNPMGLNVLSVSIDKLEMRESRVIPFLTGNGATFPSFIKAEGDPDAYRRAVDGEWNGDLPRTYVVDRQGRVRQIYRREFLPGQLETLVKNLLKEEVPKPRKNGKTPPDPPRTNGFLGRR